MQIKFRCICLLLYCCGVVIILSGCTKALPEAQLNAYINDDDNGLHKQQQSNDVTLDVFYRPSDLVWIRNIHAAKDESSRQKLLGQIDSLTYFLIHLSSGGAELENKYASDPDEFANIVSYLSDGIANDLFLTHGADTIKAASVLYARTFGSTNATRVLAAFEARVHDLDGDITLHFNDTKLDVGDLEFDFKTRDLKNTPKLQIN
jgi:hypothetical protein